MLRRHDHVKGHTIRKGLESVEVGAGDVVITPFETEMLGAIVEMLGVLAEAARVPAVPKEGRSRAGAMTRAPYLKESERN